MKILIILGLIIISILVMIVIDLIDLGKRYNDLNMSVLDHAKAFCDINDDQVKINTEIIRIINELQKEVYKDNNEGEHNE